MGRVELSVTGSSTLGDAWESRCPTYKYSHGHPRVTRAHPTARQQRAPLWLLIQSTVLSIMVERDCLSLVVCPLQLSLDDSDDQSSKASLDSRHLLAFGPHTLSV